jgi:protein SCO1/2
MLTIKPFVPSQRIQRYFRTVSTSFLSFFLGLSLLTGSFGVRDAQAVPTGKTTLNVLPKGLKGVNVREKLGKSIDLSLTFTDHKGKKRTLGSYFKGGQPVILTLNYYKCPMLCSLQLNGMIKGLSNLPSNLGKQFRIVTVSINPKEGYLLAKVKRKNYLKQLGKPSIKWDFLVGSQKNITTLSKSVGFGYKYLPKQKQYSHPAVIFVMTPKGVISQYLYGVVYKARDLKFSLMTASQGKLGTIVDRIIMSCFVYNSKDGQYTPYAFGIVRLGGVLTVLILGFFLMLFWMREMKTDQDPNADKVESTQTLSSTSESGVS